MKMNITAKKIQLSPAFSEYAQEKLDSKLDKFFANGAEAKLTLKEHKDKITAELTVTASGIIFRAEQTATDKNDALDTCIDRIIRQIRKNKTKVEKKLHSTIKENFDDAVAEQVDYEVIKHKKFELRPMSIDEAILQMNMLGHSFFMFKNAESGVVNVVYRRNDENYAVLEPEN